MIEVFQKYYSIWGGCIIADDSKQNFIQEQVSVIKVNDVLWWAEYYYLSALALYLEANRPSKQSSFDIYFEMDRLELEKILI